MISYGTITIKYQCKADFISVDFDCKHEIFDFLNIIGPKPYKFTRKNKRFQSIQKQVGFSIRACILDIILYVGILHIPGSVSKKCPRFFRLAGNLHTQKPNKAQTKRANIMRVRYFCEIWYHKLINRSGVSFFSSFILYSF